MELLGRYRNGNYVTTILSDGTRIRETNDDEFIPDHAENMDIKITFTDAAIAAIADKGFDDNYGARPLRRAIQSEIEDTLSEYMLDGRIKENSSVECDYKDDKFTFETK